jgi:hypothetical protein
MKPLITPCSVRRESRMLANFVGDMLRGGVEFALVMIGSEEYLEVWRTGMRFCRHKNDNGAPTAHFAGVRADSRFPVNPDRHGLGPAALE